MSRIIGDRSAQPKQPRSTRRRRNQLMQPLLRTLVMLSVIFLFGGRSRAQTNSGPDKGSLIEPLKVSAVTGDYAGQELDFAAKRAGKPTVFIFIQADKWDRPVARFLKVLDQELTKDRPDAAGIAVWLTDNVEQTKEYLP